MIYRGGDTFVRLVGEGSKAKLVAVRLGRKTRGNVEILSGLAEKSSIVERTSRYVADGEEVVVERATQ